MKSPFKKTLVCNSGHGVNPLLDKLSAGTDGSLICPRCDELVFAVIPADCKKEADRRRRSFIYLAVTVELLLFPLCVMLTWLSTSRWSPTELVVSPKHDILAIGRQTIDGGGVVELVDLASLKHITKFGSEGQKFFLDSGPVACKPNFLPDGKNLVLVQHTAELVDNKDEPGSQSFDAVLKWNFASGAQPRRLTLYPGRIDVLAVDRNAEKLVVIYRDKLVQLFDVNSGARLSSFKIPERTSAFALSPDGCSMVTGTFGGIIEIWDLSTLKISKRFNAHRHMVTDLKFDSEGTTLVSIGGLDRYVKIWNMTDTTSPVSSIFIDNLDWISRVALSPDRKRVFVGGGSFSDSGQIQIRDITNGALVKTFEVDSSTITCLTITPNADALIAGSGHTMSIANWTRQGKLYRWNLHTGAMMNYQ